MDLLCFDTRPTISSHTVRLGFMRETRYTRSTNAGSRKLRAECKSKVKRSDNGDGGEVFKNFSRNVCTRPCDGSIILRDARVKVYLASLGKGGDGEYHFFRISVRASATFFVSIFLLRASTIRRNKGSVFDERMLNHQSGNSMR